MKKLLSVLLATMMLLTCIPLGAVGVSAATYGGLTYEINDGAVAIKHCDAAVSGTLTIPSTIEGYPVTAIYDLAFYWCKDLTYVTIPESVASIGYCAFSGCTSLTYIYVNSNNATYRSVAGVVFTKDRETLVAYPSAKSGAYTISNLVKTIGEGAFAGCTGLTSVTIPNSVITIEEEAFSDCTNLTSVIIPDSVTTIGGWAFSDCSGLTDVTIGNGVIDIGELAFRDCTNLTSVTVPDNVKTIGRSAFADCSSLNQAIIGDGVTDMGYGVFEDCSGLTDVIIGNSVTAIGDQTFYRCTNLTTITIPDSVVSIGAEAFFCCYALTGVTVGDSVTTIGNKAFYACFKITDLTIGNNVVNIGEEAFYGCNGLSEVAIPVSTVTIGEKAFYSCSGLTWLYISNGVKTISESAFADCVHLAEVVMEDGVTEIGPHAFNSCYRLTTITIPRSVTSIGDCAFTSCHNLSDVYYSGTRRQADAIAIGICNDPLLDATWHFIDVNPSEFFNEVTHSAMEAESGNRLAFRFELAAKGVTKDRRNVADLANATVNYLGQECKLVAMGAVMTNDDAVGATAFTLEDIYGDRVVDVPVVYLQEAETEFCAFATRIIDIPSSALERTIYARPYYVVEVDGEMVTIYGEIDATSCQQVLDRND